MTTKIHRRDLLQAGLAGGLTLAFPRPPAWGQTAGIPQGMVAENPVLRYPELRAGEAFLENPAQRYLPGIRTWDWGGHGGIQHFATTESVGDGVASRFVFSPDGEGEPGYMILFDSVLTQEEFATYAGVSFWAQADGLPLRARISWDRNQRNDFVFDLPAQGWTKIFARWEDFEPPVVRNRYYLGFSLAEQPRLRRRHFVVDRIRLFSREDVEEIDPTPFRDPRGHHPASSFVARPEAVAQTARKLGARPARLGRVTSGFRERRDETSDPLTIVLMGDSILDAVQLYYVLGSGLGRDVIDRRTRLELGYGGASGTKIARRGGFENPNLVLESFNNAAGWRRFAGEPKRGGLNWVVLAAPGKETDFPLERMDDYLAWTPDLVLYHFGANDLNNLRDPRERYGANVRAVTRPLRRLGVEVALCTVTPIAQIFGPGNTSDFGDSRYMRSFAFAEETRRLAHELDCAVVDFHAAFTARGVHFVGDLFSDYVHPNHRGHRMMATLVEELLAGDAGFVWDDVSKLVNLPL